MAKRKLHSNAHLKHLILYHLIFVSKYRRKIFAYKSFGEDLKIVRVLKQRATIWAWKSYYSWLSKFYWKYHYLFTRGYYCGSVGNVSAQQVAEYLEAQGRNDIC